MFCNAGCHYFQLCPDRMFRECKRRKAIGRGCMARGPHAAGASHVLSPMIWSYEGHVSDLSVWFMLENCYLGGWYGVQKLG
jgi:hypothetical protein